ncbi:MAG: hypothetical protein CME06_05325 [Gemmatimonadetes bacterium]|nr:hypothetical protein [Gemmatimonadota bacterium]
MGNRRLEPDSENRERPMIRSTTILLGTALVMVEVAAGSRADLSARASGVEPFAGDLIAKEESLPGPNASKRDCEPPKVLTVFDLSGPESIIAEWEQIAGDSLGYIVRRMQEGAIPPTDSLEAGDIVIWTTGIDTLEGPGDLSCLTPEEEDTLLAYLLDPSPGVKPALYLESPDYLDEQIADDAVSPLATALGIADVDTTDFTRDEMFVQTCGPLTGFRPGFHTPTRRRFNQPDDYTVLPPVTRALTVVDTNGVHIPAHLWDEGSYSVSFATFLLKSNDENGDPDDYPQDSVTWVRLALTELGHRPLFYLGPAWNDTTLQAPQGGELNFDAEVYNCMGAPYRDGSPQRESGFGLHAAITDANGVVLHSFEKFSLEIEAGVIRAIPSPRRAVSTR